VETIFFVLGGLLMGVIVQACVAVFLRCVIVRPVPVSLPVSLLWGLLFCILTLAIAAATRQVEKTFFYEDFGRIERAMFALLWMAPTALARLRAK
jgi:hypothetical protein